MTPLAEQLDYQAQVHGSTREAVEEAVRAAVPDLLKLARFSTDFALVFPHLEVRAGDTPFQVQCGPPSEASLEYHSLNAYDSDPVGLYARLRPGHWVHLKGAATVREVLRKYAPTPSPQPPTP